jgi:GNAT superfamily N-acetyltransferase
MELHMTPRSQDEESPWQPRPFVPAEVTREEWSLYHAFRRVRHAERNPEEPLDSDETVEKQMLVPELNWRCRRYYYPSDAGEMAGGCYFESPKPSSPEYESTRHIVYASLGVIKPFRRRGIGTAMLRLALEELDRRGARVLSSWVSEDDGMAFAEWCGADRKQIERASRLVFGQIDWNLMQRWVDELEVRAPGVTLEMYADRLPDSFIPEYCPVRTELMNLMPWDDADHGDIVVTPEDLAKMYERLDAAKAQHHTLITREADGTISGMTDVSWKPEHPTEVEQWFTGVHPDYRGRGLGKALKAAMVLFLRERYDSLEVIRTENSTTNAAMLAINELMGFREYKKYVVYQVGRDDLARHLASIE